MPQNCSNYTVVVLGGGSFGTAISNIAADNGCDVTMWMRDEDVANDINEIHVNSRYLEEYKLNPSIKATTKDPANIVRDADIVFFAIPSKAFFNVLQQLKGHIHSNHILISCTKGIHADGFLLMSELIKREIGSSKIGVLSGPNLAKEILERQISASVIASQSEIVRSTIQQMLSCDYFRVYANQDIYGVELAGALKNIYAIASGIAGAMNVGQNSKAMLITRSLTEMGRFSKHMGGQMLTFLGLAGIGDLLVTCSSSLSRNYRVGYQLGKGLNLDEAAEKLGQVAEGINTIKIVKEKADELGIYMPILSALHAIIFENNPVQQTLVSMMDSEQNSNEEFATW